MKIKSRFVKWWKSYRYRFAPWLSYNIKNHFEIEECNQNFYNQKHSVEKKTIGVKYVNKDADKIITNKELKSILLDVFKKLAYDRKSTYTALDIHKKNCDIFFNHFGFLIDRTPSGVSSTAGTGVRVIAGNVPEGSLIGDYSIPS